MAKFKKPNLTKFKKFDLTKDFAKVNFFKIDFPISEGQKAFIYQWKAFIKALIFKHFDLKYYIYVKIYNLSYAFSKVLSQIFINQSSSNYMIYKYLDLNF